MPIYAYRCDSCGFAQDVLRKMSDPPLTDCPQCGKSTFTKQVTAAGFQLKGSGWYVTDFRDNGGGKPASGDGKSAPAVSGNTASTGGESSSGSAANAGSESGSASTSSPPAASPAPSAPAVSSSSSGSTGKSGA